ncbi:MAG TPA: hypothetical protein VGJ11_01980 [Gaiellales bacterium]
MNRILAIAFIVIGIVLIVETAALGGRGFQVGYLAGVVFIALGLIRRRASRPPRR